MSFIRPLLSFNLDCFPSNDDRSATLYDLRSKCVRQEGWFLVKCSRGEEFAGSFTLTGVEAGEYLLGCFRTIPARSSLTPDRYDVFIHGGSRNALAHCLDGKELMFIVNQLTIRGMDFVIGAGDYWEPAHEDNPFLQLRFEDYPTDLSFEILFGDQVYQ